MIGNSLPEYIFIRASIYGLRLVAPFSILYLIASFYYREWLFSHWLGIYCLIEAAFYILVYLPRTVLLQKAALHPPLWSREERQALFAKCLTRMKDTDFSTGWFYSKHPSAIRRDNVVEWILWAFFSTHPSGLDEDWEEELEGYVLMVEKLLGRKLEQGWDNTVRCMKITLDPVISLHRPFLWYLIVALVDTYTSIYLLRTGFHHYSLKKWMTYFPPRLVTVVSKTSPNPQLSYWYRPHRSSNKTPILFLHGIGIGLLPYAPFLADLAQLDPDVGIIAIEDFSISMRISPPPLRREDVLDGIRGILDYHGLQQVVVVSHSYGTVVAAHMLKDPKLSSRISALLLADPIPFLLHRPAVAFNFVYREPRSANEWQLWYFASRDPDIARMLARHFFWADNILWKEDLAGRKVGVSLSGRDQIVDAPEVWRYLTGEEEEPRLRWKKDNLEVLFYPELDHAHVFDTEKWRRPLVDMVSTFISEE
ncbi:hypothetical protein C8Q75DRAFT_776751 [Abortiporus biennis]|nr:hypothetical protein C8Q75DRAFT_776751 [Abortiporus biennis]